MLLLDVTLLSLGPETLGGVMTALIARTRPSRTRKTEIFSRRRHQTAVEVHVLQGERPLARRIAHRTVLLWFAAAGRAACLRVTFDITRTARGSEPTSRPGLADDHDCARAAVHEDVARW